MHELLAVKAHLFNAIMDNQNTSTRQAQILPGWALSAEAAEGHLEVKMNDATIWFTDEWDHVEDVKTALMEKILFLRLKRLNLFLVLVKKDD